MKKLQITGILVLIANLSLFSQSEELKTLDEKEYSIQYSNKWELDTSGQMGTSFILFSEVISENDQFKENVNLVIQDLKDHMIDLTMYVRISENQIKTMITDGKILSSTWIKKEETEYQKVIYTGKQGDFNLKFEQHYYIENSKAYVLTLTCEESEFDNFKVSGERILDSFIIQ